MIKQIFCAFIFIGATSLSAIPCIQDDMIQDIEAVKYHMNIQYAPKDWKFEHLGWTLEGAADIAKVKIADFKMQTSKEYQKVFKNFLNSTQDYHVHSIFYSTELAFFPFSAHRVDDKYYLTEVFSLNLSFEDFILFPEDAFDAFDQYESALSNFQVGDEFLAINGIPISEIVENIIDEHLGGNRTPTGYALAEKALFVKMGKYGFDVPSGPFQLTVRHKGVAFPKTYRFSWIHIPEWIMNKTVAHKDLGGNSPGALVERYMKKDFNAHYAEDFLSPFKILQKKGNLFTEEEEEEEDDLEDDYREKGTLPALGEILWESPLENSIFAYLYLNDKGNKIGYIYLPSFSYSQDMADEMMGEVIQALKLFEQEKAEGLVIDITNNPGGNLFYTYGVLSTLTKTPMLVPTNREMLIQENVYNAALIYKFMEFMEDEPDLDDATLSGYPFNREALDKIKGYCQSIINSWETGKTFTDPLYLFGIDKIMPHSEIQFDKPILVLINELDFSCADFFPAVLQDNGRATLFGKGTAGAGGYVRGYQHQSRFGVMGYTLTGSIAYRPNGNPIENLGVQPDVPYELTIKDMTENFSDYINAVNAQVKHLVSDPIK